MEYFFIITFRNVFFVLLSFSFIKRQKPLDSFHRSLGGFNNGYHNRIVHKELQSELSFTSTIVDISKDEYSYEDKLPNIKSLYFSTAKHSKTRESRIEKCMQNILNGKGLND
ncbi:hypothetical protein BUW91_27330 (plasmid) [Priestia megaterium]|nr:hypothetical protein BUW91_27330 [Priestia megaterium]